MLAPCAGKLLQPPAVVRRSIFQRHRCSRVQVVEANMKLTFRTIKGSTFNIEAEPSTTVGELKSAVEASQGSAFPKDQLKLVYKGKVLDEDAKAVSEYSVDESGFLVVFVQKAAPKPAAAAAGGAGTSTTPAPAPAPAAEAASEVRLIWQSAASKALLLVV